MKKKKRERINKLIMDRYPTCRDDEKLAAQIGISLNALRLRASKLKVKKKIKNEVRADNKKKCSKCNQYKDLSEYRHDKTTSGCKHDYYCKSCRAKLYKPKEEVEIEIGSMAFNKGKKRNKSFITNGVEYLRCKGCGKIKEINNFSIDRKNKQHGHKNYCSICLKKRREEAKIIKLKKEGD